MGRKADDCFRKASGKMAGGRIGNCPVSANFPRAQGEEECFFQKVGGGLIRVSMVARCS